MSKTPPPTLTFSKLRALNRRQKRIRWLILAAIFICFVWKVQNYGMLRLDEKNVEMSPLYRPGDLLLLYRNRSNDWLYQIGDILALRRQKQERPVVMQILAQNQGTIEVENGELRLDGQPVAALNLSLPFSLKRKFPPLEPGQIFLIVTNTSSSVADSLVHGPFEVSKLDVLGKIFFNFSDAGDRVPQVNATQVEISPRLP